MANHCWRSSQRQDSARQHQRMSTGGSWWSLGKMMGGAAPRRHMVVTSRGLSGQHWLLLWLISTVLKSSWDSEQDDTKFAKFRRLKNWRVSTCNRNFATISEPSGASFWGNDHGFLLVVKNASKWYLYIYILPMFSDVLKIILFEALSIKIILFCVQG